MAYTDMQKSIAAALKKAREEQEKASNKVSSAKKTTTAQKTTFNATAKTGGATDYEKYFAPSNMQKSISSSFRKANTAVKTNTAKKTNTQKTGTDTVQFHLDNFFAPKINRTAEKESIGKSLKTANKTKKEYNRDGVINTLKLNTALKYSPLSGTKWASGGKYDLATDDELKKYASLTGKEQRDYLKELDSVLDKRLGSEVAEDVQQIDNPAQKNVLTTLGGFSAGYDEAMKGFEQVGRGILGDEKPVQRTAIGEMQQQVAPTLEGGAKLANDIAFSGGMMAPSLAVGAATGGAGVAPTIANALGAGVTGVSSAGSTYGDTVEQGYSPDQARVYGMINGALEGGLQYLLGGIKGISAGGILKNVSGTLGKKLAASPAIVQKIVSMAASSGDEATEEYLQALFDPVVRNITLGENNKLDPFSADKLYSAALGALSAGILNLPSAISTPALDAQLGEETMDTIKTPKVTPEQARAIVENEQKTNPVNNGTETVIPTRREAGTIEVTDEGNRARYEQEIDGVFNGSLPTNEEIIVGRTPEALTLYGAQDVPLHMTQATARKIAYPEGYQGGKHNLGVQALKELPQQLVDPIAILTNKAHPNNSIIVMTEWNDLDGNRVIVPVEFNKQGTIYVKNKISTAFGKNDLSQYLGNNNENVIYTKNEKDINELLSQGLQLPVDTGSDVSKNENTSDLLSNGPDVVRGNASAILTHGRQLPEPQDVGISDFTNSIDKNTENVNMEGYKTGDWVYNTERGNIGQVLEKNGGNYLVSFRNPETGAETSVNIAADQLKKMSDTYIPNQGEAIPAWDAFQRKMVDNIEQRAQAFDTADNTFYDGKKMDIESRAGQEFLRAVSLGDIKAARDQAIEYAKANFPKNVTVKENGMQVDLSNNVIKNSLRMFKNANDYLAVFSLPKLIENAEVIQNTPPMNAQISTGETFLKSSFTMNGTPYEAIIHVRNTNLGDKYSGMKVNGGIIDDIKIEPAQAPGYNGNSPSPFGTMVGSTNNVPLNSENVNMEGYKTGDWVYNTERGNIGRIVDRSGEKKAFDLLDIHNQIKQATIKGISPETAGFLQALGEKSGVNIEIGTIYQNSVRMPGAEGSYDAATNTIRFSPGSTRADVVRGVFMHELTHSIEGSGDYRAYRDFALNYMFGRDKTVYNAAITAKQAQYAGDGIELSTEAAEKEIIAEFTRGTLFADEKAVDRLVQSNPSIARRIYEAIKAAIQKMKAYFGNAKSKDYLELERGRKLFERALGAKGGARGTGSQYTIKQTASGVPYVEIDKVTDGKPVSEIGRRLRPDAVKKIINEMDGMVIQTVEGDTVFITGEKESFSGEKTRSTAGKMTSWDKFYNEDVYYDDKLPLAAQIDEIVKVSYLGDQATQQDLSSKHDEFAANGWQYRTAFVKHGGDWLKLRLSVAKGIEQNTAYNIGRIREVGERYVDKQKTPFAKNEGALQTQSPANDASNGNVSQRGKSVNTPLNNIRKDEQNNSQYSIKNENTDKETRIANTNISLDAPEAFDFLDIHNQIKNGDGQPLKGLSGETADFLNALGENYGINIEIGPIGNQDMRMRGAEGSYDAARNIMRFSPDATRGDVVGGVAMHELTHSMEGSEDYGAYRNFVLNYMFGRDKTVYNAAITAKQAQYAGDGIELSTEAAEKEVIAEFTRGTLFTDKNAVDRLVQTNPSIARRIYEAIKAAIQKMKAYFGNTKSKDYLELERGRKLFERALGNREITANDAVFYYINPDYDNSGFPLSIADLDAKDQSDILRIFGDYELNKNTTDRINTGKVPQSLAKDIAEIDGTDVSNFDHYVFADGLRHGSGHNESTGNIELTSDDIAQIPNILNGYDDIVVTKKRGGETSIKLIKEINGKLTYVMVLGKKRGWLFTKNMWKKHPSK